MPKDLKRNADSRKGNQEPTVSFVLPYEETEGQSAVDLYNRTGRTAQPWQELILADMLAVNDAGLWTHTKFGYSVPRRNGKNEILVMRELKALVDGEKVLHTAHRATTTHAAWERLNAAVEALGLEIKSSYRALGNEHIEVAGGGRVTFRTRTAKGGIGEGYDVLIIDEAQEYQDDQESALKYVVTGSQNPQTIFTGTPPTPSSSGTVFQKYRASTLKGETKNGAWEEWSVPFETDPHDVESWYMTNPSLGTVFTERSVEDEIGTDRVDFNIQRLGLWIRYNQQSAISKKDWERIQVETLPNISSKLTVGIKYGNSGENVSMAIAGHSDGKIFVECLDCRPTRSGNEWILDFLLRSKNINKVIIDGANGQGLLAEAMKQRGLKNAVLPTVKQAVDVYALFEQNLYSGKIIHRDQPSLLQAVANCEKRAIGSNGGFGYKSIKAGVDISLLESVALAQWGAIEFNKVKKKQTVNY